MVTSVIFLVIWGIGILLPADSIHARQQADGASNQSGWILSYESVDLKEFEKLTVASIASKIEEAIRMRIPDLDPEKMEADSIARRYLRAFRALEQAKALRVNEQKHQTHLRDLAVQPVACTVADVAMLKRRLDVARQRWPVIAERVTWLDERVVTNNGNLRILREFIQDDSTLADFILARCESVMLQAERDSLAAESLWVARQLETLPSEIQDAEQRIALANDVRPLTHGVGDNRGGKQETSLVSQQACDAASGGALPESSRDGSVIFASEPIGQRPEIEKELLRIQRQLQHMQDREASLRERIELIGLTDANAIVLMEAYRSLPDEQRLRIQNFETRKQIRMLNATIVDEETAIETAIQSLEDARDANVNGEGLSDEIQRRQAELESNRSMNQLLMQVASERERLIKQGQTFRSFLCSQLVWVQNSNAFGTDEFRNATQGAMRLASPQPWFELLGGLGGQLLRRPLPTFLFALSLIALTVSKRRLERRPQQGRRGVQR